MSTCLFCRIVARSAPADVVHEDEHTLAFMDLLPMTFGHTLVVPKQHVTNVLELEDASVAAALLSTARTIGRAQAERLGAKGVNVVTNSGSAADQSVFHLHLHIVPRYGGDRLLHPWERTFAGGDERAEAARRLRGEP